METLKERYRERIGIKMKKVIYVLSLYNTDDTGTDDAYDYDILSAYDTVEDAEKGMLNYYNNYIATNYNGLLTPPFVNTIEEMQEYLEDIGLNYEINDVYYYTR